MIGFSAAGSDSASALGAPRRIVRRAGHDPVLAIVGGHSFQDYRAYRDRVFSLLPGLDLRVGRDVVLLGTVADAEDRAGDGTAEEPGRLGFGAAASFVDVDEWSTARVTPTATAAASTATPR